MDYGSGDCFMISCLIKEINEFNFIAVDKNYNSNQISKLKSFLKRTEIYTNHNSIDLSNHKINIVLMLDVIEHIENPLIDLRELYCHPSIENDAIFIITVPAFEFLMTKHDMRLGHHRRYNLRTLTRLIKKTGFSVIECGYLFQSAFLIRSLQKISEKLFNTDNVGAINNYKHSDIKDSFLSRLFINEYNMFWSLGKKNNAYIPGLTACVICQK